MKFFCLARTFDQSGPYAKYARNGLGAQAVSGGACSLGDADRIPLSLPPGIVDITPAGVLAG